MASDSLVPLGRAVPARAITRRIWGLKPFGLGEVKPHHFSEMIRVVWENRERLPHAWRVLTRGVCDGCALGTTGIRDWTIDGVHLCLVRLNLLRLNTMGAAPDSAMQDVEALRALNGKQLRALGRLPYPMRRRAGESGFTRLTWPQALAEIGQHVREANPDRLATYMTSRGIGNEVYYATQKAMRWLGSPHVENAARLCHSPSTAAMKRTLGVAASTCSYRDWFESELIVFFGSNPANDQPVAIKYLDEARKRGARVLTVNTYDEPGLRRYWIPSTPDSALFGSRICDRWFSVTAGGDLAFLQAVQRVLLERGQWDREFVAAHTDGFEAYREALLAADLDQLVARSGASRAQVDEFAELVGSARSAVFVWSMGLTQHGHGSDTVAAVCTLALSQGFVGREGCGLMPIRGHSGVQGGAEMGAYATCYPGGAPIDAVQADHLEARWGFRPPECTGMDSAEMVEAALRRALDVFYLIGGNLRDTLPQPARVEQALGRVPVRIHQDIVLSHPMLIDPSEAVYLLPARTRYEHRGGVTETTTERRVVFSPEVPGHAIEEAREEWWIPREIARAAWPERTPDLGLEDAAAIRREISQVVPFYAGIESLRAQGDQFQWGGARLCEGGKFATPTGKAQFEVSAVPEARLASGELWMSTRRGKQFNSILQAWRDPLTGADRDHVFMSSADVAALGLCADQEVFVESAHGSLQGRVFVAPITPGNIQLHWPEANVLIAPDQKDPAGKVPDYNAAVRVGALGRTPPQEQA